MSWEAASSAYTGERRPASWSLQSLNGPGLRELTVRFSVQPVVELATGRVAAHRLRADPVGPFPRSCRARLDVLVAEAAPGLLQPPPDGCCMIALGARTLADRKARGGVLRCAGRLPRPLVCELAGPFGGAFAEAVRTAADLDWAPFLRAPLSGTGLGRAETLGVRGVMLEAPPPGAPGAWPLLERLISAASGVAPAVVVCGLAPLHADRARLAGATHAVLERLPPVRI